MKTIKEGDGKTYELREITDYKTYTMKNTIVGVCTSPYTGTKDISFYIKGSNCVTQDKAGNKFGMRYNFNDHYYARSAKPV